MNAEAFQYVHTHEPDLLDTAVNQTEIKQIHTLLLKGAKQMIAYRNQHTGESRHKRKMAECTSEPILTTEDREFYDFERYEAAENTDSNAHPLPPNKENNKNVHNQRKPTQQLKGTTLKKKTETIMAKPKYIVKPIPPEIQPPTPNNKQTTINPTTATTRIYIDDDEPDTRTEDSVLTTREEHRSPQPLPPEILISRIIPSRSTREHEWDDQ